MTKIHRQAILEILLRAETALLEVVSGAATSRDYSGIDIARVTAEQIKSIAARLSIEQPKESTEIPQEVEAKSRQAKRAAPTLSSKKTGFPRFEISESTLTKVGWSKKRGQEYIHRVPREVFESVVRTLAALQRRNDGSLATELVLKALAENGQAPPTYQVYSVLGFLRSREVIRTSERGVLLIPNDIGDKARSAWLKEDRTNS